MRSGKSSVKLFSIKLPESLRMKSYPIHENLDTSFVSLSALIKYLRRNRFTGSVRVEFGDYRAEVLINSKENLTIREHDLLSGRTAEGDEALQRLLIRCRQPGGIINVYRDLEEETPVFAEHRKSNRENTASVQSRQNAPVSPPDEKSFQQSSISAAQILSNQPGGKTDFPFKLSNNIELKARQNNFTPQEWQTLLDLTGELLGTIDRTLAGAGLNFNNAFQKASAEIAKDYPFLQSENGVTDYKYGKITVNEQIRAAIFVAGIMEILRRILAKLGSNPNFLEIYRQTVQNILALCRQRKPLYDKFSLTAPLEKITGDIKFL